MSTAETQKQPSVEELLISIRQAIHGDAANAVQPSSGKSAGKTSVTGSMSQTRVNLQPRNGLSNGFSQRSDNSFSKLRDQLHHMGADAPHAALSLAHKPARFRPKSPTNGFAGILSGNVKLEEALKNLKRAGLESEPAESSAGSVESDDGIRAARYTDDEPEYAADVADSEEQEDNYQPQLDYAAEPEPEPDDQDGFSAQTRQAYIDPIVEPEPVTELEQEPQQQIPVEHQALAPATVPPVVSPQPSDPLTSQISAEETSAAFNRLADTIVGHASSGERSIDDLTRELLRPMLKSWLDEHLPRLVERLVRDEIERVARRGGN